MYLCQRHYDGSVIGNEAYFLLSLSLCVRYCECFAAGIYCDGCNCVNCCNNAENESVRHDAVEATLERNPNAFRPKIASSPIASRDNRVNTSC